MPTRNDFGAKAMSQPRKLMGLFQMRRCIAAAARAAATRLGLAHLAMPWLYAEHPWQKLVMQPCKTLPGKAGAACKSLRRMEGPARITAWALSVLSILAVHVPERLPLKLCIGANGSRLQGGAAAPTTGCR